MQHGKEFRHFLNDYLCVVKNIHHNGFHCITEQQFLWALHNLRPFERPDMYAVCDDWALILEHFEIDSSSRNRKGMQGIRDENQRNLRLSSLATSKDLYVESIESVNYKITLENLVNNFEYTFDTHYPKIENYKANILKKHPNVKRFFVGFCIENQYPPYYHEKNRFMGDLCLTSTKQFCDKFKASPLLDFVLLIGYFGGQKELVYTEHGSVLSVENQIDIMNPSIVTSHMNQNEIVFASSTVISKTQQ